MKRRILAIFMAALMLVSIMSGCAKDKKKEGEKGAEIEAGAETETGAKTSNYPSYLNMDSEFPVVKEGETVKLKVAARQIDNWGGDPDDVWIWKWTSEKMNIELDVKHVLQSTIEDQKQIMFAANELPDMMFGFWLSPTELVNYGQNEEQLLAFNKYLNKELMPATTSWFDYSSAAAALSTCPDGNVYTLPLILSEREAVGTLPILFINQTWLKAVDMNTPETLDEFTNMLRAFKEKDPGNVGKKNVIPLGGCGGAASSEDPRHYILNALGFITRDRYGDDGSGITPALRDGKAVIPCGDKLFLEYLKILNNYYKEELIPRDFFTSEITQMRAQMTEGLIGVIPEAVYLSLPDAKDFQQWWSVKPLTSDFNSKKQWQKPDTVLVGGFVASADTKYPEVVARFIDFFFTDKGAAYKFWGPPENSEDTLGIVDGWYVKDDGSIKVKNEEKYEGKFYNLYKIFPSWGVVGNHAYALGHPDMNLDNICREMYGAPTIEHSYNLDEGDPHYRAAVVDCLLPYSVDRYPNIIYLSSEENIRLTDLYSVISNYVKSEVAKFITGARPLSEFDEYLKELEALDFDEYEKIYVDAYEKYKANLSK